MRLPLGSHFTGLAVVPGGHAWVAAASGRRGRWASVAAGRPGWHAYRSPRAFVGLLAARSDGGAWMLADKRTALRLEPGGRAIAFGPLDVPFAQSEHTDVSVLGVTRSDDSFVLAGRLGSFMRIASDGTTSSRSVSLPPASRRGCFASGMSAASGGAIVLADYRCGRLLTVMPGGGVRAVDVRKAGKTTRWPAGALAHPDGSIWFTAFTLKGADVRTVIARIAPDGSLTEREAPDVDIGIHPLAAAPDGSVGGTISDCALYRVTGDEVQRVNAPFRVHDIEFAADGSAWLQGYSRLRRVSAAQLAASARPRRCDTRHPRITFPTARHWTVSLERLRREGFVVRSSEPAALTGPLRFDGRSVYVHRIIRRSHGTTTIRFRPSLLNRAARDLHRGRLVEMYFNAPLWDADGNGIVSPGPFRIVE